MKSLVIGGGGREHCIVKALEKSEAKIFAISGNRNPGIARSAQDFLLHDPMDIERVVSWAKSKSIDLAVVGPEAPLGVGIVDALTESGIPTFGPSKQAAQIETNKEFARNLMVKYKIPGLIDYWDFDDLNSFDKWLKDCDFEFVIKPIGLTGGKGVKVWGDHFQNKDEARIYVDEIIRKKIGGSKKCLVERKEVGEEFSLQVFSDGNNILPTPLAQDHKRAYEGDNGPNTGGMGSYSDADHLLPFVTPSEYAKAFGIMKKTVEAMKINGTPFRGCLYGGFINTHEGPKVLEFNARFADPECMNVLPILESDFATLCAGGATDTLPKQATFDRKATVCKYVVPEGYGTKSLAGEIIDVDEKALTNTGAELFWASVNEKDGKILTSSSRSLAIVGIDDTLDRAEEVTERALSHIRGKIYMRHDIGKKEVVINKIKRMEGIRAGRQGTKI